MQVIRRLKTHFSLGLILNLVFETGALYNNESKLWVNNWFTTLFFVRKYA